MPSLRELGQQWAEQMGLGQYWPYIDRLYKQESGWQQYDRSGRILTSGSGAQGVSQLMPATARGLGVNPIDPHQNLRGGLTYFKQQIEKFGGDIVRAVAAYNAGPGFVAGWNRTRAELHDYRNSRGEYPYRQTEKYLDIIVGPNWDSSNVGPVPIEDGRPGRITVPIPGPDNDIIVDLPSIPTPAAIGGGIVGAITAVLTKPFKGTRDEIIDTVAPFAMGAAGLSLLSWGIFIAALKSPPAQTTITMAEMVPDRRVQVGARAARRVSRI